MSTKSPATKSPNNKKEMPFFSIVMPTYGVENYIADAIRDIQEQTFKQWELLIIDDCTPDKSVSIAKEFAQRDNRIKIIHHQNNQGLSQARNTGIASAKGRYLWIPDPDDRYDCSLLNNVHTALINSPTPITIFGHTDDFYTEENKVSHKDEYNLESVANGVPANTQTRNYWHLSSAEFRSIVLKLETATHYGYAWNKVYDVAYLREKNLSFETVALIEDIVFNVRAAQDAPSVNLIKGCPYHYAKREKANLTNKFVAEYFEVHQRRIQILRDQQESWGLLNDEAKSILGALFARYILSALERNEQPEAQLTKTQKKEWCENLYQNELFIELIPYAKPQGSKALELCLKPLQEQNTRRLLALAKGIHFAKHSMGGFFRIQKTKR